MEYGTDMMVLYVVEVVEVVVEGLGVVGLDDMDGVVVGIYIYIYKYLRAIAIINCY